jgi:hypothetical protein
VASSSRTMDKPAGWPAGAELPVRLPVRLPGSRLLPISTVVMTERAVRTARQRKSPCTAYLRREESDGGRRAACLPGAVGAGRWPLGFVAWRAAALCGLGNSPSMEAKDDPAGARAGRRARRGVMIRCRVRSARVPCAGAGRRLAGALFMSSGASGGEKEGAGIYGR